MRALDMNLQMIHISKSLSVETILILVLVSQNKLEFL